MDDHLEVDGGEIGGRGQGELERPVHGLIPRDYGGFCVAARISELDEDTAIFLSSGDRARGQSTRLLFSSALDED